MSGAVRGAAIEGKPVSFVAVYRPRSGTVLLAVSEPGGRNVPVEIAEADARDIWAALGRALGAADLARDLRGMK